MRVSSFSLPPLPLRPGRHSSSLTILFVIPGLVPGIHVFAAVVVPKTWMAGTSPAMTWRGCSPPPLRGRVANGVSRERGAPPLSR